MSGRSNAVLLLLLLQTFFYDQITMHWTIWTVLGFLTVSFVYRYAFLFGKTSEGYTSHQCCKHGRCGTHFWIRKQYFTYTTQLSVCLLQLLKFNNKTYGLRAHHRYPFTVTRFIFSRSLWPIQIILTFKSPVLYKNLGRQFCFYRHSIL